MVTIYDINGNILLEIDVNDTSSSYRSIDGRHELTLKYSLSNPTEIPIGSWCLFQNERFELMSHQDVKMKHSKHYEYTLVMKGSYGLLSRFKVRNIIDGRLKFDMVAKPSELLQLVISNLNERDGGWSIGECIEADEKLISFNHTYCDDALNSIASEFDTEFDVIGKQISLKKVEYNKDNPLKLAYGKGNGLKPGVGRTNYEDGLPAVTMFVQGGSRNISYKDYGAIELHLPKSYTFRFDGEKFEGEEGYDIEKAREFATDHLGSCVSILNGKIGREDSIDLSEIYPSRVGHVSKVVFQYKNLSYPDPDPSWTEEQWNDVQVDIFDNSIPEDLDFNDCLMENNEPLVVAFQSGELAGRDFDATFVKNVNVFELKKQEYSGQPMPQGVFVPKVGDSYAVFNVSLPPSYVSDIQTHSGAEFDALRAATKVLYEKSDPRFTFSGEIDEIWSKKNWENIGGKLKIGGYVSFINEEITTDGPVLVRIVGITQNVNNPHCPKIQLSNVTHKGSVSSRISKIEDNEAHVEELHEEARMFTKRRFADAQRAIKLLEAAFGEGFEESIKPVTVHTMMMLVGDESLQFAFVRSVDSDDTVPHLEYFDASTKTFKCGAGIIKHYTLDVNEVRSKFDQKYHYWNMPGFESAVLDNASKEYYVYAVVNSEKDEDNEFRLEELPVGIKDRLDTEKRYYLLLGLLLAEYEGSRDFMPLYGFTQILPGQITTDVIRSADGLTYFDLANSEIGGRIVFKNNGQDTDLETYVDELDKHLLGLQNQIDGAIETWFYDADPPTLQNEPAFGWDGEAKAAHVGDLYYSGKGNAFRFQKDSNGYYWKQIEDEDISKALGNAQAALAAAEEAEKAATEAKAEADSAKARIDNMMKDGVFDQSEKRELQTELERIKSEYNEIYANAEKYSLGSGQAYQDYLDAYENYKSAINSILNSLATKESVQTIGFASIQQTYYQNLPIILQAIVSKAKEIADAAKSAADSAASKADAAARAATEAATIATAAKEDAEAAIDAANAVVGKIDGDSYLTEIEKQSIRRIMAEITECKEELVKENATIVLTFTGNAWYKVQKNSRAEWTDSSGKAHSESQYSYEGFYSSNMHTANGTTIAKISVSSLSRAFSLGVGYVSDAEPSYDYLTISAKGTAVNTSNTTNNTTSESAGGSTYNRPETYFKKSYSMTSILASSRRYVEVGYKKNANTDAGTDSGYFRIENDHYVDSIGNIHVVELNGSFHRYYLMLMQAGYTTIANELATKLQSIISLLKDANVWEIGTYELPSGSTFRTSLNTALTDYYVILAACGFNVMDSKIKDLDYLTNAMKNGTTIIDGGLVMSSLVAVGDTENVEQTDVDAFMNGSNFCKDTTHGKLIHAMGIPKSVTVSGTEYTDLERRSKAANTRIYEDGTIISQNAELNEGCVIGGTVKVTANGIEVDNPNAWGKLTISDSLGLVRNDGNLEVQIGGSCSGAGINISNGTPVHPVCYGRNSTEYVCATFATTPGKRAIDIFDGMIGGMRPNTASKSAGTTLTNLDHTCFVSSGPIYLPNDPQIGQNYRIIHTSASSMMIYLGRSDYSSDFKNIGGQTLTTSYILSTKIEMIELIYDGSNWWYMTSRND